jgi:8-amino-7-oxononanoate synthase
MPSDSLRWLDDALAAWTARGLRRELLVRSSPQAGTILCDGRSLVNFGANDYLGLAADPRLAAAARQAIAEEGWGAGASPLVTGRSRSHALLEERLAAFEETEAALLFPTGFAANVGVLAALAGPEDALFSDAKNHASLIDGCRLSGAQVHIYRHTDADDLRSQLQKQAGARRRFIVTDGLFSMDGDIAPLAEIADLADAYDATLIVDEAHATGVLGPKGRGACELCGVAERAPVRVGTLSKALASAGGVVAGSRTLVDWLQNRARPYMFSTAQPAAVAAAALTAVEIVESEPYRRERVLASAAFVRERLRAAGWNVGRSTSPIIPVIVGEPEPTMRLAAKLRTAGLFVPGIRPPSVPQGESLMRISVSAAHTEEQLAALIDAFGSPE